MKGKRQQIQLRCDVISICPEAAAKPATDTHIQQIAAASCLMLDAALPTSRCVRQMLKVSHTSSGEGGEEPENTHNALVVVLLSTTFD